MRYRRTSLGTYHRKIRTMADKKTIDAAVRALKKFSFSYTTRRGFWPSVAESVLAAVHYDELEADSRNLEILTDEALSVGDLEMKVRDGEVTIHAQGSTEGGSPVFRLIAALLLHMLLGEENEEPPNYRSCEWTIRPGGDFKAYRLIGEAIKPGGRSSHEIRRDLEARIERLAQRYDAIPLADGIADDIRALVA